jgi:hypothetical protein
MGLFDSFRRRPIDPELERKVSARQVVLGLEEQKRQGIAQQAEDERFVESEARRRLGMPTGQPGFLQKVGRSVARGVEKVEKPIGRFAKVGSQLGKGVQKTFRGPTRKSKGLSQQEIRKILRQEARRGTPKQQFAAQQPSTVAQPLIGSKSEEEVYGDTGLALFDSQKRGGVGESTASLFGI